MKNLVHNIGKISTLDQVKMTKRANREIELDSQAGFKSTTKKHKDKKKEADKRACREFKF